MPTLLLLDDNALVREVLCEVLMRRGFDVIAADDPLTAIEAAERHSGKIDLALIDVILPRMRCGECADRLRSSRPGLKVVYMSGYPVDIARERGAFDESGEFVMKPFTPETLVDTIQRVLRA